MVLFILFVVPANAGSHGDRPWWRKKVIDATNHNDGRGV